MVRFIISFQSESEDEIDDDEDFCGRYFLFSLRLNDVNLYLGGGGLEYM